MSIPSSGGVPSGGSVPSSGGMKPPSSPKPQPSTPKPDAPKPEPKPKTSETGDAGGHGSHGASGGADTSGGDQPKSSKDMLKDQKQQKSDAGPAEKDSQEKGSSGDQKQDSKDSKGKGTSSSDKSDEDKPQSAKDKAKENAKDGARTAVDQAAGEGTSKDAEQLTGKGQGEGSDKIDKTVAAGKLAARAGAHYLGAGKEAGGTIDKVGDAVNKGAHYGANKAKDAKNAVTGKQMMDAAMGGDTDTKANNKKNKKKPGQALGEAAGGKNEGEAKGKGKSGDSSSSGKASGSGDVGGSLVLKGGIAALAFLMAGVLIVLAMMGGQISPDQGQPEAGSDQKVKDYTPGDWQELLQDAVDKTTRAEPPKQIPWTLLAGIAAEQTDFGRYSPYDAIDRDPDRDAKGIVCRLDCGTASPGGAGDVDLGDTGKSDRTNPVWRQQVAMKGLISIGWSKEQAAGMVGNMITESGVEPTRAEGGKPFPSTWGWGLVQWTFGRNTTIVNKVKSDLGEKYYTNKASDLTDKEWLKLMSLELGYVNTELTGSHKAVGDALKKAKTASDASDIFLEKFEVPADIAGNRPTRAAQAEAVLKKYKSSSNTAASVTADVSTGDLTFGKDDQVTTAGVSKCAIDSPDPKIGGKEGQGVGPFLLTEAAAEDAESDGYDPQSPCVAEWIAGELKDSVSDAKHTDGIVWNRKAPYEPKDKDAMKAFKQNNKFWEAVVNSSRLFANRHDKNADCILPGDDDLKGDDLYMQYTQQIAYSFHCFLAQKTDLEVVQSVSWTQPPADATDEEKEDFEPEAQLNTFDNRRDAEQAVINEAFQLSYTASKWKLKKCDAGSDEGVGLFHLTPGEAKDGGIKKSERCDSGKSAAAAAKLFADGEDKKVADRSTSDGPFEPAFGGWDEIDVALGEDDRKDFAEFGQGQEPVLTKKCTAAIDDYLVRLAENDKAWDDGDDAKGFGDWSDVKDVKKSKQSKYVKKGRDYSKDWGGTTPWANDDCSGGSDTDYAEILGERAMEKKSQVDSEEDDNASHLRKSYVGITQWAQWLAQRNMGAPTVGEDTLVAPRLSGNNYDYPDPPVDASNLSQAIMNEIGSQTGYTPLPQRAVEFAIFFGGVTQPFDTAKTLIGSLKEDAENGNEGPGPEEGGNGGQTEVDAKGCPKELPEGAPQISMDSASRQIGINKLCQRSIKQARTPEAAKALLWAFPKVGDWWYSQPKRMNSGWADCSSYVSRAYQEGAGLKLYSGNGWITPTFLQSKGSHTVSDTSKLKPGDWFEPSRGHVVFIIADGFYMHASQPGQPIKIARAYQDSFNVGGYIDPDYYRK